MAKNISQYENPDAINLKLKKLNIAKSLAFSKSQKKKVLDNAETLSETIDEKIESIALNKFVIRKTKKLKSLGESREKINSLIIDITSSYKKKTIKDKIISSLKGFGVDKKFVGLSAEDILKKVNGIKQTQSEIPETESETDENPIIPNTEKEKGKRGRPLGSKNKKESVVKGDPDTNTIEDTEKNNERIYDHFLKMGDLDTANYILDLMTKPAASNIAKTSEVQANTEAIKKLSEINSEISLRLKKIEENMIDEQDTSLSIPHKLEQQKNIEQIQKQPQEIKKEGSFIESILRMLLGDGIVDILLLAKGSVTTFATSLFKKGGFWIANKIKSMFGTLFNLAIKPFKAALDLLKIGVEGITNLISKIPGVAGKMFSNVKKFAGISKDIVVSGAEKAGSFVKGGVSKFTGLLKGGAEKLGGFVKGGVSKLSENLAVKLEKRALEKLEKKAAIKLSEAALKKGAAKGILKTLLKFTKPIPFLGTALAAGTAIYAAQDGWRHADEILQKDKKDLTTFDKVAAAGGAVVEDASFGFFSAGEIAEHILDLKAADEPQKALKPYTPNPNMTNEEKINSINTNVEQLKKLQQSYLEKGENEQAERLDVAISRMNASIEELKSSVEVPVDIYKDKKIIENEKMYNQNIQNTKMYNARTFQNNQPNINNINMTQPIKQQHSSFEFFEQGM
jgi:uncharacterized protein YaaW (UPF0174 family)